MSKITDWSAAISNPAFWAIYHYTHIDYKEDEDGEAIIEEIFGCDMDAIAAFDRALLGFDADLFDTSQDVDWNVLPIPFPESYEWQIEFNTIPGVYHYLAHPGFPERLLLGYDDPHCMLPILRWAEVAPLAACAQQHGAVAFDPRALYPLFYPLATLTQADDLPAARGELAQAWADFGPLPPEKVTLLVERVTWVGETMDVTFRSVPIKWWRDDALGWITNAKHSYRNPDNGWDRANFDRWNTFFALVLSCINCNSPSDRIYYEQSISRPDSR
jgi:hypothetical protein